MSLYTHKLPTQLEKDVDDGTYFAVYVSKEVLFTISHWLGANWAKPHSNKIQVLIVEEYIDAHDLLKQLDSSRSEIIWEKLVRAIEMLFNGNIRRLLLYTSNKTRQHETVTLRTFSFT